MYKEDFQEVGMWCDSLFSMFLLDDTLHWERASSVWATKYVTAEIAIGTICLLGTSAKQFIYIQDYKVGTVIPII